jgi:serine/threonine protein kinase
MKAERWQKIERLYNSALELEPERREAFLKQACAGDESVRQEVRRLLELQSRAEDFIESPAIEKLAHGIAVDSSSTNGSLSIIGKSIGRYRVVKQLGIGGMGEVYQAKDQKLGRDVAIKLLPKEFTQDSERISRFRREAKLLASLNHPNIAAIHELEESDETHFLVLELVGGETLADQLKNGPIPVEESLKLALQIAKALEAAHEKGVIHRDLKPANIKVTLEGMVKVLDFGLAKTISSHQGEVTLQNSPTLSMASTQKGVILGTAAYMSPEQARGRPVDKRTDIWAFGCVLYEMLTGQAAFSGKDVTDILAAVIRAEPQWANLPANLHWRLREVLERCLKKESKDRYHDIADARLDIQKVLTDPSGVFGQSVTIAEPRIRLRQMLPWLASTLVLTAIIVGVIIWNLKPTPPAELHQVVRFDYELPEDQLFSAPGSLAVSPDGSRFVYHTTKGLYLRSMDGLDAKLVLGIDENPAQPFFSPDGQWVGYWSQSDRQLKKIAISGGAPVTLCDATVPRGPRWSTDDTIVYVQQTEGILKISASGGTPEVLVESKGFALSAPQILPDGKCVLFTISSGGRNQIAVQSLESGEQRVLFEGALARYLPTGHLVYMLEDNLFAVPFDLDTLKVAAGPALMVEGLVVASVSNSGTLVYLPGTRAPEPAPQRTLVWVNREGQEELLEAPPNCYRYPIISPDGTKVALTTGREDNADIWIWDIVRKTMARLTFDNRADIQPIWTLDGKRIVFASNREGNYSLYWKAADGTGEVEHLASVQDRTLTPWSWSSDGNTLVLQEISPLVHFDIGLLSMGGERTWKLLLQEEYEEIMPQVSPDGRWIAYISNESGRYEVYVRPFPDVNKGKWQVSTSGGDSPLWSPDGRELFYLSGDSTMAVAVETEPMFKPEKPKVLFRGTYIGLAVSTSRWDISPDGKRFLMMKPGESTGEMSLEGLPRKISIVTNWFEELKERVPVP